MNSVEYPHCTDPILNKEPKLYHLTNWLSSVKADWREIGLSLHVKDSELETFYRDRGLSDANRLSKTLYEWKRTLCSPYTFRQLIRSLGEKNHEEAIETVELNLQDEKIRREYSL